MEKKVFRSRASVLLMVFILAICSPPLISMIRSGDSSLYGMVGVLALIVFIFSGIRYVITEKELQFNTWGTCKVSFPLSKIVSVERSYNPLSSPAASLKRLSVRFKKGCKYPFVLISPVREQEFLETLKERNPDIYIRVDDKKGWWRIWDWDI